MALQAATRAALELCLRGLPPLLGVGAGIVIAAVQNRVVAKERIIHGPGDLEPSKARTTDLGGILLWKSYRRSSRGGEKIIRRTTKHPIKIISSRQALFTVSIRISALILDGKVASQTGRSFP